MELIDWQIKNDISDTELVKKIKKVNPLARTSESMLSHVRAGRKTFSPKVAHAIVTITGRSVTLENLLRLDNKQKGKARI